MMQGYDVALKYNQIIYAKETHIKYVTFDYECYIKTYKRIETYFM